MSIRLIVLPMLLCLAALTSAEPESSLNDSFKNPPHSAKLKTWWHWLNGNIDRESITSDLEAMSAQGYGGVAIFNVSLWLEEGDALFRTEAWMKHLEWAAKECKRLGLDLGIHNCDGWSQSFGPWIKPEQSMKKLTWKEVEIKPGQDQPIRLPQPPTKMGFYRDIAVVAFPTPSEELFTPAEVVGPELKNDMQEMTVRFDQPVPLKSISFLNASITDRRFTDNALMDVFVSDDGENFEKVTSAPFNLVMNMGTTERTIRLHCGPKRFYRFQLHTKKEFKPGTIEFSSRSRVQNWAMKAHLAQRQWYGAGAQELALEPKPPLAQTTPGAVSLKDIQIISDQLQPNGTLDWSPPDNRDWTVLRVGYTLTAHHGNANISTRTGFGLECDKFDADIVRYHLEQHVVDVKHRLDKVAPGTMISFETDSWECGTQNWTDDFGERFLNAKNYDLTKFFPLLLTGTTIESTDLSERVLWDWRYFCSDQLKENYYGTCKKVAEENDLLYVAEAYGGFQPFADSVGYLNQADRPMGEFWTDACTATGDVRKETLGGVKIDNKLAASSAHITGHNIAEAEAFTTSPSSLFRNHPQRIKKLGDMAFCAGINQMVFHTFPHRAGLKVKPGMTMAFWGMHNNPSNTWWEPGKAWIDYLTRCQAMLQAGRFHADILMFSGETAPNYVGWQSQQEIPVPAGYDWDVTDFDILRTASVENGEIVLPSGMRYKLLVCPSDRLIRPAVLKKLLELVRDGANIMCPKPEASPSYENHVESDALVQRAATMVWGNAEGEISYGKGKIFWNEDMQTVLNKINLLPDVSPATVSFAASDFIHRVDGDKDIYFIRNDSPKPIDQIYTFRITGKEPELWNAVTETQSVPDEWEIRNDTTDVRLKLDKFESIFVVFQKPARKTAHKQKAAPVKMTPINGPWKVSFPENLGAPSSIQMQHLTDWTKNSEFGVKYFSGTATYQTTFEIDTEDTDHVVLDLGTVKNLARVHLNGKDAGVAWTYPYQVDITEFVKKGKNKLDIEVTNTWANRLIGDAFTEVDYKRNPKRKEVMVEFPEWLNKEITEVPGDRIAFLPNFIFTTNSRLESSGLLGPVVIKH